MHARRSTWAAISFIGGLALMGCAAQAGPTTSPLAGAISATSVPSPSPSLRPTPSPHPSVQLVIVTPIPGAADSGVKVKITASVDRWSTATLAGPAGKRWRVIVNDQDGGFERHNFIIESGSAFEQRIFSSPDFTLGTYTFDLPALPAGTYTFLCTIHPSTMTGTLTIG